MAHTHPPSYYLWRWLALVALALIVYAQTFGFGFVFDDYEFIVNDPYIKSFTRLGQIWEYFPLTRVVGMYSFALNYSLNQLNPAGYHIFNVAVHIAGAALVWGITSMLLRNTGYAPVNRLQRELPFVTALLFLVHPCQIQAVTYISQRFESMAAVFYLAVFYCYVRARTSAPGRRRTALFIAAAVLACAGMLTKETVATIPLMLLAYEWIFGRGTRRRNKWFVGGIAAGLALFIAVFEKLTHSRVVDIFSQVIPSESHDGDIISGPGYILTQLRVFLTFLRLLIFPVHQNLDYDYPLSTSLIQPPLTLVGLAVMLIMAALVFKLRRTAPLMALGLAWILITFSINMAPRSNVIFEHKLYLISFGFFLALTAWVYPMVRHHKIIAKCLICALVVLSALSILRNQVWKSELALWEDIARKSPGKSRVLVNLGRVYGEAGRLEEAARCFTRAIGLAPNNGFAYANRGVIHERLGRREEALQDLNRAIILDPKYYSAFLKRAWVHTAMHNEEAALADLGRAIEIEPNFPASYIQRAMLSMQKNRLDDAYADAQKALRLAPFDYDALIIRGVVYYTKGMYEPAVQDFTRARTVNPANPLAYKNLAFSLQQMGRKEEADDMFRQFTRIGVHQ